ncbi:MAG: non-ribosomal peptide synthetase [Candidatus Dormibacteria bacterium]
MADENAASLSPAKRALLEQRIHGRPGARAARSRLVERTPGSPTPLSLAQEQLWYFSQLAPDNPAYNEAVSIRKHGDFDADVFARVFNEVVRRHESWRTTFEVIDGQPLQRVGAAPAYGLPIIDLRDLPVGEREHAAAMLAVEDSRRPYDLERGALMRPRLVRMADDQHRLYLSMHHLIFDGVTLYRVILPELISLYEAFAAGRPSPLTDPDAQYADYTAWEREYGNSAAARRALEHWRGRLEGVPTLQLPLDHPRPAHQRFRGGMEAIHVPRELADRLRLLSREAGATLFQVIAAAFAVLLHDYSGQEDVVFATVTDLRRRPDLEAVVGYCLTPLVLRADLSEDPSFTEVLRRVRSELIDALDHHLPFAQLVRELRPRREPGANPIFQAMIVLEPPMIASDPSWSVHQMEVEVGEALGHAKLDLHIELDERPEGHVAGRLIYNSDLFTVETARRAAGHWHTLLESIAAEPGRRISELSLLTQQERHRVLVEWNSTSLDHPRDACVHDLVAAQVARTPDAVAVVFGDERLTFSELDERAGRLAERLRRSGVGPGDLVAICVERSLGMIVGLLGILKSGAGYVPLDPGHPSARLAFMLEDSRAAVLLTQRHLRAGLPEHGAEVLCVDADENANAPSAPPAAPPSLPPDAIAYVIYTSGSTGTPKGVRVSHSAVVNLLSSMAREPGCGAADTVLAITTSSFDMSVPELWLPLTTGATMVVAPAEVVRDGRLLGRLIDGCGATFMQATPSTWQMLVDSGWKGNSRLVALSGGDTLEPGMGRWLAEHTAALWNAYGPTETTVWSTLARLQPGDPISVGRPIGNTRTYVLNRARQPVPVGVAGELFIGGEGVAAGYLGRPDLTDERFLPDPWVPGGRIYRTGDRARVLGDGRLQHLGRLDQQLKIRGFRVEPGDIEVALRSHPQVGAAVVISHRGPDGSSRLAAYVVPQGPQPSVSELRRSLRALLPEHMIPSTFVWLDALPLTTNGKLDRAALAELFVESGPDQRRRVPPRTPLEQLVADVWSSTLQVSEVGVDDDFFEQGGHSLLAVRLLVAIERELGVEIPLSAFFEGSGTVAGLATIIEQRRSVQADERVVVPVQPQGTTPNLFFIHPDESSLLTMRHFTGPLGTEQGVVGLLPERTGKKFDRSRTIEDLAEPMLETIRHTQPHGPYVIAGYSLGGVLAYEVAGRLRAAGEEVAWLGVLDAATPPAGVRFYRHDMSLRQRLARQRRRGLRGALSKTHQVLRRDGSGALVRLGLRRSAISDDFDWRGARSLIAHYACVGHDAPLNLFVTDDCVTGTQSRSLGWAEVHRGSLEVNLVGGDHLEMVIEPHVSALAASVSASLRSALRASLQGR